MMETGAGLFSVLIRMLLHPGLYRVWQAVDGRALFAEFSRSAATTLLTAFWQGLVIAIALGLSLRFAPRVSAGSRFVILAGGFAAVVALPFLPALARILAGSVHAESSRGLAASASGAVFGAAHPWLVMDARWSVALTLLWLGASVWRASDLAVHTVRLRRLWKDAVPVAGKTVALTKMRGRKPVELCTTEELERPSVIGFLAPRILIPAWLLERMTDAELEQIVLHESEHLRRGDDWTNLVQKLSLVVFPLNPALLWMERRLCLEREMACDEGVVRRTRAPRAYAACLTHLAEHGLERRVQALSLGAWQRRPELARRVHSLLSRKPALQPAAAGGLVAVLGCVVLAGAAELARCPQVVGFTAMNAAEQKTERMSEKPGAVESAALEGDRVLRPELRSGLMAANGERAHATELRAVMPAASNAMTLSRAAQPAGSPIREAAKRNFHTSAIARERMLRQEVRAQANAGDAANQAQAQGWVVMTAMWEQTETAPAAMTSDTAAAGTVDPGQPVHSPPQGSSQIRVTQVVWRVAPERSYTNAAGGQEEKSMPAPQVIQPIPTIVPVRGGWLIFQL
jgi:beta-lactamase regulating signal transducer with metallopeptidase domain